MPVVRLRTAEEAAMNTCASPSTAATTGDTLPMAVPGAASVVTMLMAG